ncbi:MAG: ribosome-associated translation inhibitor RaiA [Clostridia bacterium]|nr:ribosome-associated translation inhibitor RaiA [Clostridia bacterium]MBQ2110529.1 ribosome-associated translation inhibitor RaiA [Clostridia bacterium]MBQ2191096.1 ribosome-associated translation inhibitor RaiA [Clostridia bacterium]MBQ5488610.1 ribosome-associated translation inhibitor RaiA [Clostridia bacterium]MBR4635043.1 ribosome-associated translation inhibitor RaiA [Clostridia bacterium]
MNVTITGKNMEVTDYLRELTLKKIEKLDKYFPQDTEAQVVMAVEKSRHIIEVTIPYRGGVIRGEEVTGDMYASIDNVIAKLDRQIQKHKTRLSKSLRYEDAPEQPDYADEREMNGPEIVRVKRFVMKPMTVEEAMLQIELLGHNFFVFTNAETNQINVLYTRKDGNYGLIEPER